MKDTTVPSDFDTRASTWDDDPMKTARAESVAAAMVQGASWKPRMRGLEFGCGTGLLSFALRDRFSHIGLADTSPGMLDVLRQKIAATGQAHMQPLLLDEATTALQGQQFSMIYSLMTLHHVSDTRDILERFHGWLEEGGQLCIADLDAEDGSFHSHDPSVHNGFDRTALTQLVEVAGFGNVRFVTAFEIAKGTPERLYPVFLMVAEKH